MNEVGEDPEWDAESGTWTAEYTISDTTYYAWIEDEATIREKLNLVKCRSAPPPLVFPPPRDCGQTCSRFQPLYWLIVAE